MGTLGTYLREARETRGFDLREAAQQTRISVNYLKAIESEDFSKLPGEVFVKGFLKSYAKFLGLSEADVMQRYGDIKTPPVQAQAAAAARAEQPPAAAETVMGKYVRGPKHQNLEPYLWGGLALFAVVAIVLTILPGQRAEHAAEGPGVSAVTPTTALATGPAQTAGAEKLYLEIEAIEDAWVLVRTDASPQKKAALRRGEIITWSAEERFLLSYGGIGSIVLRLNGQELTVTGPRGAVVRDLMITASGIAAQKVEPEPKTVRKPRTAPSPTVAERAPRPVAKQQQTPPPAPPQQQSPPPAPPQPSPSPTPVSAPAATVVPQSPPPSPAQPALQPQE